MNFEVSRRGFLGTAAAGSAALLVGLNARGLMAATTNAQAINPFVKIGTDGVVTVVIKHFEMGQGTTTGLTTLVAEELDVDWEKIDIEFAPADQSIYANLFFKVQGTGGSTAIANSFMQYREAGAAAREVLVSAAAQKWGVAPATITIENGVIKSGKYQGEFGEFAMKAASLTPSEKPKLKANSEFRYIGNAGLHRTDNVNKTNGTATFAMDVKVKGMVYAMITRSPKFGGKVVSFDATSAKSIKGFLDAKVLPNKAGVVVYATNTWNAIRAKEEISVEWDFSAAETRSSADLVEAQKMMLDSPEFQATKVATDQASKAVEGSDKVVSLEIDFPYLAHAPMEPMNCVIEPTDKGVRVHDGCQFPSITQPVVAAVLQLKPEQVEINTVYAGGSFGRRANPVSDYHMEAAFAFALLGGKVPVKLVWSREDDIKGGFYRPKARHRASIGLDKDNKITAWDHRVSANPIMKGTPFEAMAVHNGVDHSIVEGVADTLYQIPSMSVGVSDLKSAVPVLWWRSVGHSHTAYAMESLLDQTAVEAGVDPVELRLSLLDKGDAKQARFAKTIETARDISGWSKDKKLGFAAHYSFSTYVATVADVSVNGDDVHINKLYIAVDCGVAINPDVIKAQMEGASGYGISAVIDNEITFDGGEVEQENFPDYTVMRIGQMPEVQVEIVKSDLPPSGVGEPALPPVGPAIANAIFAHTGKRITDLPFSKAGFNFV